MNLLAWTDQLPDDWEAKPLRSVADYIVSNVDKLSDDDEAPVRLCNYTDVYNNEFIIPALGFMHATASEAEIAKFGLAVDDVLITKDSESWDDIGVPALVRETAGDLVCGYHLALLRPLKHKMDGTFLFRCLQAKPVQVQLELAANGVTRFGIPKSEIGTMRLPVPPLAQQQAIADYLDRETKRLDALVAAKERVLALLTEKRRTLITRAVTRGIHSHVQLRESGSSWLGKIPAHWTVKRLKFVITGIDQGSSPQCFNIPAGPGSLGVLKAGCVNGGRFREQENKTLPPEMDADLTHLISHGDILMSRASGSAELVGSVAIVEQEPTTKLLLSDKIFRLRIDPTRTSGRYLVLSMGTALFRLQIASIISGAEGLPNNVAKSDVLGLSIAVPPLEEQRAIADHLDNEMAALSALGKRTRDTILLLNERRSALIAAAVTGQIDIRVTS